MDNIKISATANVGQQTWDAVAAVLDSHHLTISDALYLLMQNIADEGDLPFSCIVPGPATVAAMKEAERGEMVSFESVGDLMAYLNEGDDEDEEAAN